ncbi:hypothetical protein LTS18_002834 [Coniosporium uncinatum]|uniref:Uncharacterized protein n=1 Tax=Coniosporium uncinatum TaxID=93489 RepID=A0ACC3DY47_9PEZI|nr:hypothetical protein LTS18_002834 [Coniosporium uncinatum]
MRAIQATLKKARREPTPTETRVMAQVLRERTTRRARRKLLKWAGSRVSVKANMLFSEKGERCYCGAFGVVR